MLASQLCMFDDKTDSKSKWIKKTHSMVALSGLSRLFLRRFWSAMLCCNLMMIHAKLMSHALT